ncbi:hypothetical protein B9K03_03475 [Rothia sp. Olga]|nr:hypothetical protein B9K03_03475 [Rothia sp. Olga]
MDVIFIEDRKEFDSITRNENLKYVQEHRNTVLLTPNMDIPRNVYIGIKLTDSNVGYSVKYISGSANVYSVGSVWVELNDIDNKMVKDNIKVSLGTTIDYYKNLKVALETENPDEYIAIMHDSLKELSESLNKGYSKESELYKKDYNFCVRAALFDDLFANYNESVHEIVNDYLMYFESEDDYTYNERIDDILRDLQYAVNNDDEEEYKRLSDILNEEYDNHQKYIKSPEYKERYEEEDKSYNNYINELESIRLKSLEGIKNHNMYYLAYIADFKESIGGIENNKYRNVLEVCENFTTNLFWSTISLDEFLDKSDMEEFFDFNKESENLLVFESDKNLSISKNSVVLVGSNGVGKSLFLDTVYKFLYGGIRNYFEYVHLKETFVSKGTYKRKVKIIPSFIGNQIFDKEEFIEMFTRVLWESPEQVRLLFSALDNDPLFQKLNLVQQVDTICSALNQKFDKQHDSWWKIFGVNGYYKCIEDVYKEIKMYDFYSLEYQNLSDGQKRIINIIIFACFSLLSPKYQKYNSKNIDKYESLIQINWGIGEKSYVFPVMPVIIIDEPENSLHPPYVSALLKILNIFCKVNMYGCSIMATHSPIVLQEFTSDMVRIVERDPEGKTVFKRPDFETYGENIGILTDRIFGRDPLNTGFRQTLKNIVNNLSENELSSPDVREKYIYPKIGVTSLGMEASMVLNGLISSRRKNIELKEKNSEDSR